MGQALDRNWEPVLAGFAAEVRRDPDLADLHKLPDVELWDFGSRILKNLGRWMGSTRDEALARWFERMGRVRFQESIPLYEVVRGIQLLRNRTIDSIRQIGAGEELETQTRRFFDGLIYHAVRGYEEALRKAAGLSR